MANTTADAPVRAIQGRAQAMREADTLTGTAFNRDALHGYKEKQVELAFQQIASMADTLHGYLQENVPDNCIDPEMVITVVAQIGMLADLMSGSHIVGTPVDWIVGGGFQMAGEA